MDYWNGILDYWNGMTSCLVQMAAAAGVTISAL